MWRWFRKNENLEVAKELLREENSVADEAKWKENPKDLLPGSRIKVKSPAKGIVSRIDRAPDQAFSRKELGDGVLIYPAQTFIVAPFDATVTQVMESQHAVGLKNREGVELFIHVGIDTVRFKGRGFKTLVQTGDEVREGQRLLEFDRSHIRANAISDATPVVVTNMKSNWEIQVLKLGNVEELEPIFEIVVSSLA